MLILDYQPKIVRIMDEIFYLNWATDPQKLKTK